MMKFNVSRQILKVALVVGLIGVIFGVPVAAAPILTLDDGMGNTATVHDTDGDGIVSYFGSLGSFIINMTTGFSAPTIGTSNTAALDLLSLNLTGGAGGSLIITLADTFSIPILSSTSLTSAIGGVTTGLVGFETFINGGLMESFGFGGSSPGTSFSDQSTLALPPGTTGPFNLAIVTTITHGSLGATSFNGAATVHAPEPATLTLLGTGLLVGGILRRRKKMGEQDKRA